MDTIQALCRAPVTIAPGRTLQTAAALMERTNVGCLAVVDEGRLVGVVTDRDIVRRGVAKAMGDDARIDAVMSSPVVTVDAHADLHEVVATFGHHPVRRVAVVSGERLVGILSVDDLLMRTAADLTDLIRPVAAEAQFGHHDPPVPALRPMIPAD